MTPEQEIYFARCFMESLKASAGEAALSTLHPSLIDASLKEIAVEAGHKAGLRYATVVSRRNATRDKTIFRCYSLGKQQVVCTQKEGQWSAAVEGRSVAADSWPEMKSTLRQLLEKNNA